RAAAGRSGKRAATAVATSSIDASSVTPIAPSSARRACARTAPRSPISRRRLATSIVPPSKRASRSSGARPAGRAVGVLPSAARVGQHRVAEVDRDARLVELDRPEPGGPPAEEVAEVVMRPQVRERDARAGGERADAFELAAREPERAEERAVDAAQARAPGE